MSTQTTALATTNDAGFALAGFGGGVNATPFLKPEKLELIQLNNADPENGLIAGQYHETKSQENHKKMLIVVLNIQDGRILFPPYGSASKDPICKSLNGLVPLVAEKLIPQASTCKTCPMGQWKKLNGKPIKPACSETKLMKFLDANTGFPYFMQVKRTGVTPVKDLYDALVKQHLRSKGVGTPVNIYGFITEMSATKVQTGTYTYYIPTFTAPKVLPDPETFAESFKMYTRYVVSEEDLAEEAINDAVGGTVAPAVDPNAPLEGEYVAA